MASQPRQRVTYSFPRSLWDLMNRIVARTGRSRGEVIRLSLLLISFLLEKAAEGYRIQLVHPTTGETIAIPNDLEPK